MVERDLGSTYLMPQSKLYKPADNRVIFIIKYIIINSVNIIVNTNL